MNKKQKFLSGFTLIELLVVLFITILISVSVVTSFSQSRNQYAAATAAQKFVADLRRVQNMALSGKLQSAVPNGYGLYSKTASQYIIFYNTDGSRVHTDVSADLETINLEKSVLSPVNVNIFFKPPDPKTYINGANSGSQVFIFSSGAYNKSVTIYASGRIDIQ